MSSRRALLVVSPRFFFPCRLRRFHIAQRLSARKVATVRTLSEAYRCRPLRSSAKVAWLKRRLDHPRSPFSSPSSVQRIGSPGFCEYASQWINRGKCHYLHGFGAHDPGLALLFGNGLQSRSLQVLVPCLLLDLNSSSGRPGDETLKLTTECTSITVQFNVESVV